MSRLLDLSLLAAPLALAGCAMVASPVGNAAIYTSVRGPVAVGEASRGTQAGEACAHNILGIVATGDASIAQAKRNGSVSAIESVDHHSTNILGVYSQFCTIVTGLPSTD